MLKIECKGDAVINRTIQTRQGKTVDIREQDLWVHGLQAYPVKVVRALWRDDQPYQAGFYTVTPESFVVNRYGRLELDVGKLKAAK